MTPTGGGAVEVPWWLFIALFVAMAAGWPLFFFVYFRHRKQYSIPVAVSLGVVLGYFAICLIAPLGLLVPPVQREFGNAGVISLGLVSLVATFFPHAYLITRAIRASRQRHAAVVGQASEPSDGAASR
jgi:hypothetical protein